MKLRVQLNRHWKIENNLNVIIEIKSRQSFLPAFNMIMKS